MNTYVTVACGASAELEVRRSRFIGQVARVDSDPAAREFIVDARRRHRDATHHCTAFVIGPGGQIQRSNDDGEPSGTAGMPMLAVLTGRGLSDVVAVVTRYYGGTQLGAGGLVRAYGDAVAAALDLAGVRQRVLNQLVEVAIPVADAGRFDNQLRTLVTVLDVAYGDTAIFRIGVPAAEVDALKQRLAEFTAGKAVWTELETEWLDA